MSDQHWALPPRMADYHARIMNLGAAFIDGAYLDGHRDARHAAAEIAVEADARIEALEAEVERLSRELDRITRGTYSLELARLSKKCNDAEAEVERLAALPPNLADLRVLVRLAANGHPYSRDDWNALVRVEEWLDARAALAGEGNEDE